MNAASRGCPAQDIASEEKMQNDRYIARIDFDLTRELARRLDDIIQRGIVGSKPEAIRQAFTEYFNKLDEQQLRRARLRFLEEKGTMPQR